jgi:TetR/AcrR family transcriptional repressor of nem operon
MRITRAETEENRRRIVDAATNLFREKGFNGVGVIEIMNSVGLTHGGFYAKFESKAQLEIEATLKALDETQQGWVSIIEAARNSPSGAPLSALLNQYLSRRNGLCVFATLGSDVARQDSYFRTLFAKKLRPIIALVASIMPGRTEATRRRQALTTLSTMIGGLILLRAMNDKELAKEMADAIRDAASDLQPSGNL